MHLPAQHVQMRLLGSQVDRLCKISNSGVEEFILTRIQLGAVLVRLPQPRTPPDRFGQQGQSPAGLAVRGQLEGSLENRRIVAERAAVPSAEEMKVSAEDQAQKRDLGGARECPCPQNEATGQWLASEKHRQHPGRAAPLPGR